MAMKEFRTSTNTITDRSKESVAIYLREINHIETLSPEQEAELARIIRRGGKEAENARERLINANLKFVISVANQYKSHLLELSDLISEGNIGLVKAAYLFDETKGFKFISYAVWWIRQSIIDALGKSGSICRLPQNQQNILKKYRLMQQDMLQKEQRQITVEEFCEVSGIERKRVIAVLESAAIPVNMDQKIADDSDTTFADFLSSDSYADSELDKASLHYDLVDVIDSLLTEREAFVVKSLYGLECEAMSLDKVAHEINLSHERTRQICLKALCKIRNSPLSSRLNIHLAA